MRPIRGPRHPADDERTVEALPDEPTLSAQVDVRAAFEATDRTMPLPTSTAAALVPIEEEEPRQDRTMPLVSPAVVRDLRAQSQARMEAAAPVSAHVPLPPPSDPVLVTARRDEDVDDQPVDIPGVGGAQRKRMQRIVFGVLGVCALMCVGAVARQVLGGAGEKEKSAVIATATAETATVATATATATATPTVTESAPPAEKAASTAVVPPPEPVATPVATPLATPVAAPPPPARVATPIAASSPAAPARRPAPPVAAPRGKPAAGGPAKPRAPIVRDAPF